MFCLPTLSLGMLFAALLLAQIINRDNRRLPMTFLFAILTLGITQVGCHFGGDAAGWISFVGIIALIILVMLVHAGVFENSPSIVPNPCVPKPDKPACEKPCPLCPGDNPCPIPEYLPE